MNIGITSRTGMTLVEVAIAMSLIAVLMAGLFLVGLKARGFAEHSRVSTEARSLGKQRLEELVSVGVVVLRSPNLSLFLNDTNASSQSYAIIRRPRIYWHAADGTISGSSSGVYAEVHVDTSFYSPLYKRTLTNTYSMLVHE